MHGFSAGMRGMRSATCVIPGCWRLVNHFYATCCASCVATTSAHHSEGCSARQELLKSIPMDVGSASTPMSDHSTNASTSFRSSSTLGASSGSNGTGAYSDRSGCPKLRAGFFSSEEAIFRCLRELCNSHGAASSSRIRDLSPVRRALVDRATE